MFIKYEIPIRAENPPLFRIKAGLNRPKYQTLSGEQKNEPIQAISNIKALAATIEYTHFILFMFLIY